MFSGADGSRREHTLDELRRVIRRIESARPFRLEREPVEKVVGGELVPTDSGPLLVVRREYPLSHRHGRSTLADAFVPAAPALSLLIRAEDVVPDPHRLLFLDVETTGLAGGTGTYAFLIGLGYLDQDRFVVAQHFMRDLDEEPALLAALDPLLGRAAALVTFNGSGFDTPLLETRFILARRRWPAVLAHVDLLRAARGVWSTCLDDCRLTTLEQRVLGLVREHDVPGALIPSLYFDYLRRREAAPLRAVFDHNRDDVLSLVGLLAWFVRALDEGNAAISPAELAGVGRLWERADLERSAACYRAALAAGLAGLAAHRVRLRLAWWEKRRARWEAACALWEAATQAGGFDLRPWEELAKFHEHRRQDFGAALDVVRGACALAETSGATPRAREALSYRQARLERRLQRSP